MDAARLTALIDATWPAVERRRVGEWTLRRGGGGGSRVCAATAEGPSPDIAEAEAAMREMGQVPLVMVREGEEALDAKLAARGYLVKDPVTFYSLATWGLTAPPEGIEAHWPPTPEQAAIWAAGGIGPERLAVMARAEGPKTALLARSGPEAAATVYVAIAGDMAMLHALETAVAHRRKGLGAALVRASASWAAENGAERLAILVTRANTPANSLYCALGATAAAGYHYRVLTD
ncbi:GNAT family N-acetyltransferase [Histidinibacterium aquaticum]|uniref:GNAT family N-acetyltransferase n=1 Tax=Histidinibacterium aquaticum TaxID=2613962 RepID=A0A5J5GG85_9RHOB|nr:GNAT family N-acetyltransferase [Histidinibacterium aquaticum]KAA9007097.1 GNAT family N-acetyltransferase [Histidinibacterium aquaticum]